MKLKLAALCALAVLPGCKGKPKGSGGAAGTTAQVKTEKKSDAAVGNLGTRVATGTVSDLRASPDGTQLAWLKEAEKPRLEGVPSLLRVGELWSVPAAGGEARKLGNGVSNFPGGYLFSPDSTWALVLVGYNAADQRGELQAWNVADPKSEKQRLGTSVSYMLASPDSKLVAFVDAGVLKLGPLPNGPFRDVAGDVSNVEFSPDSTSLVLKRKASAGGALMVAKVDGKESPTRLSELAGDYKFSPDGRYLVFTAKKSPTDHAYALFSCELKTLKPKELSQEVFAFVLSPDGKYLARMEGLSPEAGGRLVLSQLDGSGEARKLGETVRDVEFSKDSKSLAWRDAYSIAEQGNSEGDLKVAVLPDGTPKQLARRSRAYEWSPDSKSIAFTVKNLKPLVSVDLYLYVVGAEPVSLKTWVYDYDFTADSKRLLFRADCVREGRACNLFAVDVSKPAEPPKKLIEGIFGFKLSTEGNRALFTYAHTQNDLYDVGVIGLSDDRFITVEQSIRMPPTFLDAKGSKVAYLVGEKDKSGVYVAEKGFP